MRQAGRHAGNVDVAGKQSNAPGVSVIEFAQG
jgi:hypothetical protein